VLTLVPDGLYLVDVGWKGSMQDNISSILGKHIKISGYYIGLLGGKTCHLRLKRKGFFFQIYQHKNNFSLCTIIIVPCLR